MGLRFVIFLPVVLIVLAPPVMGQTRSRPGFDTARPAGTAESIVSLLQSGDPREQAWGAWYAGASVVVVPQFAPLLQQVVAQRAGDESLAARAAFDVAVDALVQLDARVPEALVRVVHERSQAAALILASHNRGEMSDFLREVVDRERDAAWFTAANLLLQSRHAYPPGFAAILLKPLSIRVDIWVSDTGAVMGAGGTSGSVGCGGGGAAPGLPPWPTYALTTGAHPGVVVLSTGPTPSYYQRVVSPAGSAPAPRFSTPTGPSGDDRLRYLGVLAGIEEGTLPLRGTERHSVRWQGAEHLQQTMLRVRADIGRRHTNLIHLLLQRRALADDEARVLPPVRIELALHDARSDTSAALRFPQ